MIAMRLTCAAMVVVDDFALAGTDVIEGDNATFGGSDAGNEC
jgi:hypothetical protein